MQTQSKQPHVFLYDCEALVILRFRHLVHYFFKPGDFADISVSKILHFVQSAGLLCSMLKQRVIKEIGNGLGARVTAVPTVM
jgi:hypothetical protein